MQQIVKVVQDLLPEKAEQDILSEIERMPEGGGLFVEVRRGTRRTVLVDKTELADYVDKSKRSSRWFWVA